MTTKSEDLSSTHISGRRVAKTILKQPYWENLHTSKDSGELYLEDGSLYHGTYKVDLVRGGAITDSGEALFYKNGKPTKNPSSVPYGIIEQRKQRKIQARKSLRKNRRR